MKPVTLNLPDELVHAVDTAARADLRSRSNYVRQILEERLAVDRQDRVARPVGAEQRL
jgi:metal-responsive CopG/Arc/MetJ family transcriptional regulator